MVCVQCKGSLWQMFFKIGARPGTLFKRDSKQVFSYEIYEIFKNTFFHRTPLLWWLLLAVNCVNQWKHNWKFMLPRKKWYTWTVLLRLVFLDKEYSSEVIQTLLALPHFSKVAVAEAFCKKVVLQNLANHRCFSCKFCEIFKNTFFHKTPPVAASKKLKAEAVVRSCSVKKVFLEILLNSQENTCARASFLQS